MRQLALDLPALARDPVLTHVETGCQATARRALAAWREWPGGLLALAGPQGAGKSHLAALWRLQTGECVQIVEADLAPAPGPAVLEDADRAGLDERRLLALIDAARAGAAGPILFTARTPPAQWAVALPDLRSRLAGVAAVEIGDPTDADLAAVFAKHLGDRGAEAAPSLLDYVVRRIERTFAAAEALARALDRASLERKQRISRKLAADVLGDVEGAEEADD